MSTLQAYRRPGGEVGIRNHLFALPVVVCANQVAIDVARKFPASSTSSISTAVRRSAPT